MKVLDRRRGKNSRDLPKAKSGIPIKRHDYNSVTLVNNVYVALTRMHQLCWNAYGNGGSNPDLVRRAKHDYHSLRRKLSLWDNILCNSRVVRQYWSIISLTLRFALGVAMQRGRPHCGDDREQDFPARPTSSGTRIKVIAFFSEESPT